MAERLTPRAVDQAIASKGSNKGTPKAMKSATLRVTTVRP